MTSPLSIIADALVNDRLTLDPPVPGTARGKRGEFTEIRRIKDQLMFAYRLNSHSGARLAPDTAVAPQSLAAIAAQIAPDSKMESTDMSSSAQASNASHEYFSRRRAAELTGVPDSTVGGLCQHKRVLFRRVPGIGKGGVAREVAVITISGQHHLVAADGSGPYIPKGFGRSRKSAAPQSAPQKKSPRQAAPAAPATTPATSNQQSETSLTSRLAAIRADAVTQIHNVLDEHLATMPVEKLVALAGRTEFTQRLYLALPQEDQPHA